MKNALNPILRSVCVRDVNKRQQNEPGQELGKWSSCVPIIITALFPLVSYDSDFEQTDAAFSNLLAPQLYMINPFQHQPKFRKTQAH